ncbi:MAG TPA: D-alanyl-D-alanine carboxypeptidase/D-alanyl-D-alanine-endopeptidase [bacterium]|nr:D-alanyl-D-alanine carboxypeptidase/D-alanyl-D-alanine-endopeptidase [bacterium]
MFLLSCSINNNLSSRIDFKTKADKKISGILNSERLNRTNVGVFAKSLKTGKILCDYNSDKLFIPASTLKIITAISALKILKPEFKFKTEFYTDGFIEKKTVANIYIKGFGDPEFQYCDLEKIVLNLSERISEIKGGMFFDCSYYDKVLYGKGWMWDDLCLPFSAPVSALNINGNRIRVSVDSKDSQEIKTTIFPDNDYIKISNNISSGSNNILINRIEKDGFESFDFSGNFPVNENKTMFCSVIKPEYFFCAVLKTLLKKYNVKYSDNISISEKKIPENAILLERNFSNPLSLVIRNFLKSSDNLTGECLIKAIGAETSGETGNYINGLSQVNKFLDGIELDSNSHRIEDGSGLSRYNLVSPKTLSALLEFVYDDFSIYPEFCSGLPTSGTDGTLINRLNDEVSERRIRAKTGYMSGIRCITGYIYANSKDVIVFSIMMNGITGLTKPLADIQDEIINVLIQN